LKVLFIFREEENILNYLVRVQADSLAKEGIEIETLPFFVGGFRGYFQLYKSIRQKLRAEFFDLVHAHYGFTCLVAGAASNRPVVASLMGSDVQVGIFGNVILRIAYSFYWKATIVKSQRMKDSLRFQKAHIIPNGVPLERFYPMAIEKAREVTGFKADKNVLFVTVKPQDQVKNLVLAKKAVTLLNNRNVYLNIISDIPIDQLVYYYNSADVLLLTSLSEGSPNVIKEAMACNCPIVSTDVGDVKEIVGNTAGCFICSFDPSDVAEKLRKALESNGRTNGRKAVEHLRSELIAKKIADVYSECMNE
jgi:teichuronic acid biosynthesis glycosyltransferase TuaC